MFEEDDMEHQRKIFWSEGDLRRRLRRVEGQIRGIEAMVERMEGCEAILVQLAATQGALSKIIKIVEACRLAEGLSAEKTLGSSEVDQVQHLIRRLIR